MDDHNVDLSELAKLPHLETLRLMNVPGPSEKLLARVAAIPHLHSLVIVPDAQSQQFAAAKAASYGVLRDAPELRTFYFGELAIRPAAKSGHCDWGGASRSGRLSGLCLLPRRSKAGPCRPDPGAVPCAALGYQLATQFHGPSSRVLPGFVPAQAIVATGVWLAIAALSAWMLRGLGYSSGVAIALAAALTSSLVAAVAGALLNVFRTQPAGGLVSMFATLWCIFLPGLALLQPWWFEIYRGTTLGGSLLLTAGCAGWLVRRLRPGREMAAEIARSKGAAWQMPTTGWRARFLQRFWQRGERRIEALRPATTDRTGWQRASAGGLATPRSPCGSAGRWCC